MKIKVNKELGSLQTTTCVRHPKIKATVWSGHIIDPKKPRITVLAGWCSTNCCGKAGFVGFYDTKEVPRCK